MEQQKSSIERKVKILKSGGEKIKKDLRKSREVRFCRKVQMAREQLKSALESVPNALKQHIQLLTEAIQNVIDLLELTRNDYHSKGLRQIREYAENLLGKNRN